MRAHIEVSAGTGALRASVGLERDRADTAHRHRWVTALVALLVVPFSIALTADAISYSVNRTYALPAWLFGGGDPGFGRILAIGPLLAIVLLVALHVRLQVGRRDGRVTGALTARLTPWELCLGLVAAGIAALFVGHGIADSLACARGIHSAC